MLGGCAALRGAPAAEPAALSWLAEEYVQLSLKIGEREDGYIDAFYGPPAWAEAAKAACSEEAARGPGGVCSYATLTAEVHALQTMVIDARVTGSDEVRRRAFLRAQLKAAETRLRMMSGETLSFEDEAEGLFGVRPVLKPLSAYDPVLEEIEALVPGEGPLWQRVDAFNDRFIIPADRLKPVMDAAIAECRRRTMDHIALPADEKFTLEFVTGKSWSGYNWYKGDATSLIQINTDLPVRLSRAVDLGCHEGYPGHHVLNMLLEERLSNGRGWVEFTVYPLFSPQSLIAEGSANYGIELAFPGDERQAFEVGTLYPLAGLDPKDADAYLRLLEAQKTLAGARFTIASQLLSGKVTRDEAIALTQRYGLVSAKRAAQTVAFSEQYRSYVINYGLGLDMVRAYVEAAGPDQAARWKAMEAVISEPTLPSDLVRR
ncbi:MAG: hypothetical protein HY859_07370 [Caulobacterales bacterium]|nr:hypothetical protein [Caulobacterales bacterium]